MDEKTYSTVFFLITTTVILLLLSFMIINLLLIARNRKLKHLATIAQSKTEFEKELINTRLEVAEHTLQEIASDLHDDVGQSLTLAIIVLNRLEIENDLVNEVKDTVKSGLDSVRNISRILSPEYLQTFGLNQALLRLQERINRQKILQLNVEIQDSVKWSNREQELYVFRILQELATNTIKYADAKQVFIKIQSEHNKISTHYSDDGKGFTPQETENGMGMLNIQKRIELMGGQVHIDSKQNEGLRVQFTLNSN